jgi:hypothetical protein
MKNKIIKKIKIAYWIFLVLSIFFFLYYPLYFSADARYARDNLEYMTGQMEEKGICGKVKTHGFNALKYPYPITISKLCNISDEWTIGYLKAVDLVRQHPERAGKINIDQYSPYDTLSKLYFNTNDDQIKAAYQLIEYDAAVTNPDIIVNKDLVQQWNDETKTILVNEQDAVKAMFTIVKQITIALCCLAVPGVFMITVWIYKKIMQFFRRESSRTSIK